MARELKRVQVEEVKFRVEAGDLLVERLWQARREFCPIAGKGAILEKYC